MPNIAPKGKLTTSLPSNQWDSEPIMPTDPIPNPTGKTPP